MRYLGSIHPCPSYSKKAFGWLLFLYTAEASSLTSLTSLTFFSLLFSVSLFFMCVYYYVKEIMKKGLGGLGAVFFPHVIPSSLSSFSEIPAAVFPPHYFSSFVEAALIRFLSNMYSNQQIALMKIPRLLRFIPDFRSV